MPDRAPVAVLIVEDEPPARALLKSYVAGRSELALAGAVADGHAAVEAVERLRPALVLLDIRIPGLDGFAVLDALERGDRPLPRVIVVTAFDRYAVRAFEVNAIDYLLKPVSRGRFDRAVDRALAALAGGPAGAVATLLEDALRRPPQRLLVPARGRIHAVPVSAIDWIEAESDYVRIHAEGRTYLLEKTLTEIAHALAPRRFARVHRGAVVNLDRVSELRRAGAGRYRLLLSDGTELPVGRSYAPLFDRELL